MDSRQTGRIKRVRSNLCSEICNRYSNVEPERPGCLSRVYCTLAIVLATSATRFMSPSTNYQPHLKKATDRICCLQQMKSLNVHFYIFTYYCACVLILINREMLNKRKKKEKEKYVSSILSRSTQLDKNDAGASLHLGGQNMNTHDAETIKKNKDFVALHSYTALSF